MTWTLTDRVTRVLFFSTVVLACIGLVPLLMGQNSLLLMVGVLILFSQAWRFAMARQVRVQIDDTGISKTIGARTWHLSWAQARQAELVRFLGTDQLVVSTDTKTSWNGSDKLLVSLRPEQVAVQVPAGLLGDLRLALAEHGLVVV